MNNQYSLTILNNSGSFENLCVYQRDPAQASASELYSLAWLSKPVHQGGQISFIWEDAYGLTWSESGPLQPGETVQFNRMKPIDLCVPAITASALSMRDGTPDFVQTDQTVPAEKIRILTDNSIPANRLSVGIGISGAPAFALDATPNFSFVFEPHPEYYIAFGDYRPGEVLDRELIHNNFPLHFDEHGRAAYILDGERTLRAQA